MCASALLALTPALASETITYTYDARGRLVTVGHSGTVNSNVNACYAYDKADNRSNVNVSTSGACSSSGGSGGGDNVAFSIASNGAITEGANSVFTVNRAGTASQSYSVNYATTNGTAAAPGDYTSKSGTLTFATTDGSAKTVSVPTIDDSTVESQEAFTMTLSSPTGGATIGTASATGKINDNDTVANQPPVANFDNAGSVSCGNTKTYNLVANDTDPDGNYPLSLVSASGNGVSVSVVSSTSVEIFGSLAGTKSFTYVVNDSLNAQATGSGTVTITAPCQ